MIGWLIVDTVQYNTEQKGREGKRKVKSRNREVRGSGRVNPSPKSRPRPRSGER